MNFLKVKNSSQYPKNHIAKSLVTDQKRVLMPSYKHRRIKRILTVENSTVQDSTPVCLSDK